MKNLKKISAGIAMLVLVTAMAGVGKALLVPKTPRIISGTVTAVDKPLPGVSVTVKDAASATQTGIDGKYSITAKTGDILIFSFIGMREKRVKVGYRSVMDVAMQPYLSAPEETIVLASRARKEKRSPGYAMPSIADEAAPNASMPRMRVGEMDSRRNEAKFNHGVYDSLAIPQNNNESYDAFVENPFESPSTAPLSTFSIDVDNASYTNIRRFINQGQRVPKDAVRIEEMINFFKYKYPEPKGQHPFSINTEYSQSPWNANHKLLRIGLQGRNIPTTSLPASNLVFLIDVSGSMNDTNKLPLLIQSMKILVNELRPRDKVSIVVYAGAAGMVLAPTSGANKPGIIAALEKLQAGGSTAGGEGIKLAYKIALDNFIREGNNRVILATDGDFNVGASSDSDMQALIEDKRKSGVFLTCLGFGMGNYKDSKMETLANKGNGNYAYIDNIQEAKRFLGKEFRGSMYAIAKDVKIQIEFNPKHVAAYRLIGYENRRLRPEDFTDDQIDAGELGSGHTVTALYEIIPVGVRSAFLQASPGLKYTATKPATANFSDELATVKFRYKKPDGEKSIEMVSVIGNSASGLETASSDFRFSAAVAWFGLKLRESKLISNSASDDIVKLARAALTNDADGYRAEFVRLVESEVRI